MSFNLANQLIMMNFKPKLALISSQMRTFSSFGLVLEVVACQQGCGLELQRLQHLWQAEDRHE